MISINITKKLDTAEGTIEAHFELEIDAQEFITLFGSSGAGKTTLMRMIAGLEKPKSGTIIVNNEVWFDSNKRINLTPQKRSVGFVFQDYALFPTMSVKENLLFAAENDEQRKNVDQLIEMIELTSLANRLPYSLSGGQKQRVALARALVRQPKILLLDEPLSALDPSMRQKLQNELALIHKQFKVTTLLVSHDIAETVKLSNRLASVEAGQIKKFFPPWLFFKSKNLCGKMLLIG
jgi:molybdate transport system ATP-binding protein